MTLAIGIKREAAWRDLGFGVRFRMRPATSIEIEAARASAKARIRAALDGGDAMRDLGLASPDLDRLADPDFRLGLTRWLIAAALAVQLVTDWQGVVDLDTGSAAPLTPRNLAEAFREDAILDAFEVAAYALSAIVIAEGKEWPLPPNGSAAGAAPTAEDAPSAATPAPPATDAARSTKAAR